MADHGGVSHGVARTSRERTAEQKAAEAEKITKYRELEDEVRAAVARKEYTPELFQLTSKLLRINPEYYTIWNVRRRSLISGLLSKRSAGSSPSKELPNSSPTATTTTPSAALSSSSSTATPPAPESATVGRTSSEADTSVGQIPTDDRAETAAAEQKDLELLRSELGFTIPLLMKSPKCYWIWNYRLWILQQAIERLQISVSRRIWEEELGLVEKMLNKDKRNFHAWGYRRHVVMQLESHSLGGKSMVESEFEYTTKMIRQDLSNFSAWHRRSKLISRLLDERHADDMLRKDFLNRELNFIREKLNVGPEDYSLWYYHQFLMLNLVSYVGHPTIAPALTQEERATYIIRELDDIKDLLEDYPDYKLIYEALLEYTLSLCQVERRKPDSAEKEQLAEWLEQLKKLDPMRSGRWADLEKDCGLVELTFGRN
ncbi:hypothetical protein QBC34DRAFT_391519 [Podospora aff. communis PSN243]|uniref:Geranylgeranyl transferase type-2 subunit alpha n=1 Tax=Podospora aff. communis PSN243 TaxID=3040156 RepID=A0AAV9H3V0_9PEZI|nr:hypothetical protein QBC34DRAFT_391519 [Podospora aff. communis PSN243]